MSQISAMSSDLSEYSADDFGYVVGRSRRNSTRDEEVDPYEQDTASSDAAAAPQVSYLPPTESTLDDPPRTHHGPRVRVTPRKSVPLPQRVTFENSQRVVGESSRPYEGSRMTQIVTGIPASYPQGMNPTEREWVRRIAADTQVHKTRLSYQHHILNNLSDVMEAHHESLIRNREATATARREIRRLYRWLFVCSMMMLALGIAIGWMLI